MKSDYNNEQRKASKFNIGDRVIRTNPEGGFMHGVIALVYNSTADQTTGKSQIQYGIKWDDGKYAEGYLANSLDSEKN